MKNYNLWKLIYNWFFIGFNLTKADERPSKDKKSLENHHKMIHIVEATVLPGKETIMTDELTGYTKTKLQIQVGDGNSYQVGQTIQIKEPYYEGYYSGKKCMVIYEKYEPLIVGRRYKISLIESSNKNDYYQNLMSIS